MIKIDKNASLKRYNTLGLEVYAQYFASPESVKEIQELLGDPQINRLEKLIVGAGSNMLYVGDYKGIVIHPNIKGVEILKKEDDAIYIKVGAGVVWDDFVSLATQRGWGGVENLSGIPGCVGASPVQNIGAYGVEVGDVIVEVEYVLIESGELKVLKEVECHFGYRDSIFKNELKSAAIITHVTFKLSLNPKINADYADLSASLAGRGEVNILEVREAILKIRESKLPDPNITANAGSFFKNPVVPQSFAALLTEKYPDLKTYPAGEGKVKIPAGWMIDRCGFKGYREGNVGVHKNQALVLVAYEGATGEELLTLAQKIKRSVRDRFGIDIEPEVNIITCV